MGLTSSLPQQSQHSSVQHAANVNKQAPYHLEPGYSNELRAELPVATPIRNVQQPARQAIFSLKRKNEGSLLYALAPQINTMRVRDAHSLASRATVNNVILTNKQQLHVVRNH